MDFLSQVANNFNSIFVADLRRKSIFCRKKICDDDHPLLYHPCTNDAYNKFRFSDEGEKFSDPLKAFCGVDKDGLPKA